MKPKKYGPNDTWENNIFKRADLVETCLNNHIGYDNSYSKKLRDLVESLDTLKRAEMFHVRGILKTEVTKRLLSFNITKCHEPIYLSPDTIKELITIYERKLSEACDEGEKLYLKINIRK